MAGNRQGNGRVQKRGALPSLLWHRSLAVGNSVHQSVTQDRFDQLSAEGGQGDTGAKLQTAAFPGGHTQLQGLAAALQEGLIPHRPPGRQVHTSRSWVTSVISGICIL